MTVDEEEIWDISDDILMEDINEIPENLSADSFVTTPQEALALVRWIVAFMSFVQAAYQLSDGVASLLISFFKVLFSVLSKFSSFCLEIAKVLPRSLYELRKLNGTSNLRFARHVVCRKCHTLYSFSDCVGATSTSKLCSCKAFPNHPQARMRRSCDTVLLKTPQGKKSSTHI